MMNRKELLQDIALALGQCFDKLHFFSGKTEGEVISVMEEVSGPDADLEDLPEWERGPSRLYRDFALGQSCYGLNMCAFVSTARK